MKKVVCLAAVLFAATLAFGEVFPNGELMVEEFFSRGKYIKVIKDSNNIAYFSANNVRGLHIDENDIKIDTGSYHFWLGGGARITPRLCVQLASGT